MGSYSSSASLARSYSSLRVKFQGEPSVERIPTSVTLSRRTSPSLRRASTRARQAQQPLLEITVAFAARFLNRYASVATCWIRILPASAAVAAGRALQNGGTCTPERRHLQYRMGVPLVPLSLGRVSRGESSSPHALPTLHPHESGQAWRLSRGQRSTSPMASPTLRRRGTLRDPHTAIPSLIRHGPRDDSQD